MLSFFILDRVCAALVGINCDVVCAIVMLISLLGSGCSFWNLSNLLIHEHYSVMKFSSGVSITTHLFLAFCFSTVIHLNGDFDGGQFYFTDSNRSIQVLHYFILPAHSYDYCVLYSLKQKSLAKKGTRKCEG